jgi:hypothetical protein
MGEEAAETLSAFVDGEPVDVAELASALAGPGGSEMLLDFARLRAEVADGVEPSEAFVERTRARLAAGPGARHRWPSAVAAAAVLALAAWGALDLGRRWWGRPESLPAAASEVRFEPGVDWHPVRGR